METLCDYVNISCNLLHVNVYFRQELLIIVRFSYSHINEGNSVDSPIVISEYYDNRYEASMVPQNMAPSGTMTPQGTMAYPRTLAP